MIRKTLLALAVAGVFAVPFASHAQSEEKETSKPEVVSQSEEKETSKPELVSQSEEKETSKPELVSQSEEKDAPKPESQDDRA